MPESAMFSVRGIGVAESVSTSTFLYFCLELFLLRNAEALFLVHNDEAEVAELYVLRNQAVRADDHVDFTALQSRAESSSCSFGVRNRESSSTLMGKPSIRRVMVW